MSILKKLGTPIFYAEGMPNIDINDYKLTVDGMIDNPMEFDLRTIKAMPKTIVDARLTSVSRWSVRAKWEGVLFSEFIKRFVLQKGVDYITFISVTGYDTTVELKALLHPRVLLCYAVNGEDLEIEYGGPLRMFVPNKWGYKSVKALSVIRFTDKMQGGFWEDRGYSRIADIESCEIFDVNSQSYKYIQGGEVTEF